MAQLKLGTAELELVAIMEKALAQMSVDKKLDVVVLTDSYTARGDDFGF
jgi:hypothetical protein